MKTALHDAVLLLLTLLSVIMFYWEMGRHTCIWSGSVLILNYSHLQCHTLIRTNSCVINKWWYYMNVWLSLVKSLVQT